MAFEERKIRKQKLLAEDISQRLLDEYKAKQDPQMRAYYLQVAESARARNFWLFDKKEKKWYTPDEFLHYERTNMVDHEPFLMNCTMRDPLEALKDGNKRLIDLAVRVIEYERRRNR